MPLLLSPGWDWLILTAVLLFLFGLFLFAKKSGGARKTFIAASFLCNVVYLVWRVCFTLPLKDGVLPVAVGLILFFAECMGFFQSAVFRLIFWKPFKSSEFPPENFKEAPAVDVFIATYNESSKILKKTITGCLNLDYPSDCLQIYLCDDSRRLEIRKLCEDLGVHYITRSDNESAKAGNLNNALRQTSGKLILLLDADMVPKSSFLRKTVGYFVDETVGFVQTPQAFYNPDPFQFNLKFGNRIPNEQDFFMMDIQSGRANFNAVLHVGTNALFRRKALDEIGGIPTGTITEDMATGMLIQARGYRSVFVREVLCTGLSVENFRDLVQQRERWCRGNIQVFKKWNPLRMKGLTFMQKLIYLDGFIYWFFGVQKLIYILCPLLFLIFGVVLFRASAQQLILFWTPSFFASVLTFRMLSKRRRSLLWSHIYEVAMAPYIALSALAELLFSRPIPFRVTPKGTKTGAVSFSWRAALPQLFLAAATLAGWYSAGHLLMRGGDALLNSLIINLAWSVYNFTAIAVSVLVCLERPRQRASERLDVTSGVAIRATDEAPIACSILDISEDGASVQCRRTDYPGTLDPGVQLDIEDIGMIGGDIVWTRPDHDKIKLGIRFRGESDSEYKRIARFVTDHNRGYHPDPESGEASRLP